MKVKVVNNKAILQFIDVDAAEFARINEMGIVESNLLIPFSELRFCS